MIAQVPQDLPPRQLRVTFQTHSVQVANANTDEVYLAGSLERGIVPEDCLWTQGGGPAEEGCLLLLKKMNLELLQRCVFGTGLGGCVTACCCWRAAEGILLGIPM